MEKDETLQSARRWRGFGFWKSSIRVRFTLLVLFIMMASIGIIIMLNLNFLEGYYLGQKEGSVVEMINKIDSTLESHGFDGTSGGVDRKLEEEVNEIMFQCWNQYNISVMMLGTDGTVLFRSTSDTMDLQRRLLQYIIEGNMDIKPRHENDRYQVVIMKEKRTKNRYMDAFGFMSCGCIFLLSTPVESIRESVAVSNKFFMITGLIVALLAGIYTFFIMKRMTRPVLELSDIASRMARQDFDARYQGKSGDEIGILGESMNHMSAELEKTITDLKAANEQLQKDIEEKIQIDDMRKEFLSNVSHELKTPIAIIQGYAEGLQACVNDDPEDREFYCEVIMDEAAKMNQMVQKLLNLNHLEFGSSSCEITSFDLTELVQGMIDSTMVLFEQKEGTVTYEENTSSMQVLGDEFMIEEVLKNYLSNAANHLDGEKKVRITAEDSDNNRVRISVYNTGELIPEEALEKVWVKFYKVDKARTREYGGSGIGLSIVKAIMDLHGCPYGVYNKEDGVVFWFELDKDGDGKSILQ